MLSYNAGFAYTNACHQPSVMAGLDPAIHVFVSNRKGKTWITGTSPVMTDRRTTYA